MLEIVMIYASVIQTEYQFIHGTSDMKPKGFLSFQGKDVTELKTKVIKPIFPE